MLIYLFFVFIIFVIHVFAGYRQIYRQFAFDANYLIIQIELDFFCVGVVNIKFSSIQRTNNFVLVVCIVILT